MLKLRDINGCSISYPGIDLSPHGPHEQNKTNVIPLIQNIKYAQILHIRTNRVTYSF